jgi:methylmalonyl-CoA mutase
MPENEPGFEALKIAAEFPPVATAEWEAVIQRDLKGADYEKKLVWRTDEGIPVRPYYRQENIAGLEGQTRTAPGQFPFVRGAGADWEVAADFTCAAGAIRADELHEAGANAVQELAYALAAGVERLAKLAESEPVDQAAGEMEFVFAVGSTYFMEIAKLRAARMLWAQVVAAFKPALPESCNMRLIARTSRLNKSVYDANTNLLRVTTEALSAAIGGCDKLYIEPFGFEPRLALGVQRVVKEEGHLDAVADPAGGSYYVEALTDAIAAAAWRLFQQVEAEGGYAKAVKSGAVAAALAQSRAAREKAVSSRRRAMVGVNNYPNVGEKTTEVTAPNSGASATFQAFRLAEPFEKLRVRTANFAAETGRCPKVLLLKRGDVKMRGARANFALNFFGCAGFDFEDSDQFAGTDADLIVLCSSDPEYLALAQEVCPAVKVPVIVAGNPKEQIDALKAAGVQGFVHVMSDAIQTLSGWQTRLGMKEVK